MLLLVIIADDPAEASVENVTSAAMVVKILLTIVYTPGFVDTYTLTTNQVLYQIQDSNNNHEWLVLAATPGPPLYSAAAPSSYWVSWVLPDSGSFVY